MSETKLIPKPQLRGLLRTQIKRHLIIAVVFGLTVTYAQKVLVNDRRKAVYAEFYKNYDIDKEFEKMRAKGLFDSC